MTTCIVNDLFLAMLFVLLSPATAFLATPSSPSTSLDFAARRTAITQNVQEVRSTAITNETPHHVDETHKHINKSPLSMTVDELSEYLGGRGRALIAWDLYRIGVDPLRYYNYNNQYSDDNDIDASVFQVVAGTADSGSAQSLLGDFMSTIRSNREDIASYIPSKRRIVGLGKSALERLNELDHGPIEERIGQLSHISTSADGTTKLLIRMVSDGLEVETVIIPWMDREPPTSTLCVSSQVGCKQGCTFCATGKMGRLRSLTADEILCQLWYARKVCRKLSMPTIDNIVFMGMGEPADNSDAVLTAARAMTDRQRYQLSQQKVTISTVGPSPDAFRSLGQAPTALAWSVHASRDALRQKLVPTTKYTMEELRQGFVEALKARPKKLRTTMLEVVLIDDVNDGLEEADHLAAFSKRISSDIPDAKVVVNLIPYNSINHPTITYRPPTKEAVRSFQRRLMEKGVMVYVRTTRGDDESAACGQLATKKKRKEEEMIVQNYR